MSDLDELAPLSPEAESAPADLPTQCVLTHPVFRRFAPVLFRHAEDGETPVMQISLGDRVAVLPIRALQREMNILDDGPDGRMLGLIAQSLAFVNGLQINDPLPAEVVDGRASWEPSALHRAIAGARLRLQLAAWLRPEAVGGLNMDDNTLCRLDEDPAMRQHVQAALEDAAATLGLAGRLEVVAAIEVLAEELSYIEALRDRLLHRVGRTLARVNGVNPGGRLNSKRQDILVQVRRLGRIGERRMQIRFDEVDAMTSDVMESLKNADSQCSLIRSRRDWLYRLSRGWEPILTEWDASTALADAQLWPLLERTYRFLAPRYMPVQEWQAGFGPRPSSNISDKLGRVMTW